MTQYIIKVVLTVALVVAVTEVSKRSTFLGGLLASLPLVSLLSLTWLYLDTRDTVKVASLSMTIFWLVVPSLAFLLALPAFLRMKLDFFPSLGLALVAMLTAYGVMMLILPKLGVKL
jgi:hypothetical protein